MPFKYSYSSFSNIYIYIYIYIHIVKLVGTSFIYLFYIKLVVNGIWRKKEKLMWCFIWLLAGHHEITHSVRSRESVDSVLILWKMIIVSKPWSLKTFLFPTLQICHKVVGKTSLHQESKLIEIGEFKYIKEFDIFFHRQGK